MSNHRTKKDYRITRQTVVVFIAGACILIVPCAIIGLYIIGSQTDEIARGIGKEMAKQTSTSNESTQNRLAERYQAISLPSEMTLQTKEFYPAEAFSHSASMSYTYSFSGESKNLSLKIKDTLEQQGFLVTYFEPGRSVVGTSSKPSSLYVNFYFLKNTVRVTVS